MPDDLWETIVVEAAAESVLWRQALRGRADRERLPVFSPLGDGRFALAVESIYEGYLLHYGLPRLFAPGDADTAVLLGDYLYAHGLVRLAAVGDVSAVADLADLISVCTQLRAGSRATAAAEGAAWAATVACLGAGDGRLERARLALRLEADAGPLARLAAGTVDAGELERALAAHRQRVE